MMMLVLVLGTAITFSSCGNDDDNDISQNNNGSNNGINNDNNNGGDNGSGITASAMSVAPIGDKYLISVYDNSVSWAKGWDYSFSSDKLSLFGHDYYGNKINYIYSDGVYKGSDHLNYTIKDIKTNQDGFITSLVNEVIKSHKTEEKYNLQYSGKKLVKLTFSTQSGTQPAFTDEYNFKWENGNIVQVEVKIEDRKGDERDIEVYDIAYDQKTNTSKQNTYFFAQMFNLSLSMIGLTGEATQELPCGYKRSFVNTKGTIRKDNSSYYLTYTINNDGTLANETKTVVYQFGESGILYSVDYIYIDKK